MNAIETMTVEQLEELLLSLHPKKGLNQIQEILARLNYLDPSESDVDAAWQDFKKRMTAVEAIIFLNSPGRPNNE